MSEDIRTIVTARADTQTHRQLDAVEVVSMAWWQILLVRAGRVYLMTLVGLLGTAATGAAGAAGIQMPVGDFSKLLIACASASIGAAVISILTNGMELLARLDQSAPKMRA